MFCLTSCSKIIGYSVVRWTVSEYNLSDGIIVPVYIKSNIMHQYVIEVPGREQKVEVPFWILTEPTTKSKAKAIAEKYTDYEHRYAKCTLDGLPIRAEPENGSKQVYRLRQDEIVRTLYKGNGVIPTNGKENLTGEWLRVLAKDGTEGWCFSLNLKLFTMNSDGSYGEGAVEADVQEADETLEKFLAAKWYPDYYSQMIKDSDIDEAYFKEEYGFDTGSTTGEVHLNVFNLDVTYPYAGVSKVRGGVYRFNNTSLQVTVRNDHLLVVQYTDETGKPHSYSFVTMSDDFSVEDVLTKESDKRSREIAAIMKLGPDFVSSNYGTLMFKQGGTFTWQNYNQLVPNVIARGSGTDGTVSIKYSLGSSLKSDWDGVLTLCFDKKNSEMNLLYKKASGGLRLSLARVSVKEDPSTGREITSVYLPGSSFVMFFQNAQSLADSEQ